MILQTPTQQAKLNMNAACSELLMRDTRTREILAARQYALYQRHLDAFPALFAFGDVVELELAAGATAAGTPAAYTTAHTSQPARTGVPAVVIDVLHDNWLRLLVPARWAGSSQHHVFHVKTWNVALKPEWASAPRAELRGFVFSGFVLQLALLAAAVFDPADFEEEWHMVLKSELAEGSENLEFIGFWDQRFMSGIESATLFVWDF